LVCVLAVGLVLRFAVPFLANVFVGVGIEIPDFLLQPRFLVVAALSGMLILFGLLLRALLK